MKRSALSPGAKSLERGSTFASRGQGLKRSSASGGSVRRPLIAWCANGCERAAVHRHHVVYQAHVRAAGGDIDDERDLLPLCVDCHAAHHNRTGPLALTRLPDGAYAFAAELLGAPAAFEYLARRYDGSDPRHTALLVGP